jgi:hypothetical protein
MVGSKKVVGIWPDADNAAVESASLAMAFAASQDAKRHVLGDANVPQHSPPEGDGSFAAALPGEPLPDAEPADQWWVDDAPDPAPTRWPSFWTIGAAFLAVAWLTAFTWSATRGFAALPTLIDVPMLIGTGATPVLLLVVVALFAARSSTRASHRQLHLLDRLTREQSALDERLAQMTTRWFEADQAMRAQSATFEQLSHRTTSGITSAASLMQEQMDRNIVASAVLAERSEAAQRHLEGLSLAVPKLDEVATRLGDRLRQAGQSAYQAGGQLEAQIAALGSEGEAVAGRLALAQDILAAKTVAIGQSAEQADTVVRATADAFAAQLATQRDAAIAMVAELTGALANTADQTRDALASASSRMTSDIHHRMTALLDVLNTGEQRAATIGAQLAAAHTASTQLDAGLGALADLTEQRLTTISASSEQRFAALGRSITGFNATLAALSQRIGANDREATDLLTRAEAVLVALDAVTRELDQSMPTAINRLNEQVDASLTAIASLTPAFDGSSRAAEGLAAQIMSAQTALDAYRGALAAAGGEMDGLDAQRAALVGTLDDAGAALNRDLAATFADLAPRIESEMAQLQTAVSSGIAASRADIDALALQIAELASSRVAAAIEGAIGSEATERVRTLSDVAERAVSAASNASDRLMRQLITIADSSAALEQRAATVAEAASGAQREGLARQLALLTQSLNSTALDLVRMLDRDIADQAWEAYLKGDRSIFTRRTARLLSASDARDLRRRYDDDEEFRAQVGRYIHDFEAMLRGLVDTADGAALSVTLLSSDAGKIYVALAQAIERLRN